MENSFTLVNRIYREPVLSKIFFFDNLDRKENPYLEFTIPELTSRVWTKSYDIFEEELYQIISFFESKCELMKVNHSKTDKYQDHITQLLDLESLHKHEFIILKNMSEDELARISHEFRLRLQIDDLNTFVISRNLIYLTFLTLLEYVESIEEEIIYFLIILTFLMIFIIKKDLPYFSGYSETTDYSIYEIARTLSDERRINFESLISDSVRLYDIKQADMVVEELILLMFGGAMKNSELFEVEVNKILDKLVGRDLSNNETTKYDQRRRIQELMHANDTDKVIHNPIKTLNTELLEVVISSKPHSDRFKSDFRKSRLSNQMLNILLSGKICVKDWIEKQDEEWGLHFHLHYNDCDGQFEGCD
ncbi:MAG: hypothetical protein HeimC2_46100, partial [Candidatus Heimdallarchaeota archaeon LC_2]